MSETMFTPGPWESGGAIVGAGNIIIRQQWECVRKSIDELQANASLIAAAPDMYNALENILQLASTETTRGELVYIDFTEIRDVLKKARGES